MSYFRKIDVKECGILHGEAVATKNKQLDLHGRPSESTDALPFLPRDTSLQKRFLLSLLFLELQDR